ncbi:MAG TPA: hypothetical protein VE010_13710, partial [Thermoanaerobaculia bacterium]|nr:hypothetical protein [Thermoanaerobaculia bacterium]
GLTGAMLYKSATTYGPASAKPATIDAALRPQQARPVFTTTPVIETYESDNATIVEVPTEDTGDDVKIVMIFDENLPADL